MIGRKFGRWTVVSSAGRLERKLKSGKLRVLTYPQEEKDGMLYRLREAVAKQAPDIIVKVMVEIASKVLAGNAG